jgi:hypothetical protein
MGTTSDFFERFGRDLQLPQPVRENMHFSKYLGGLCAAEKRKVAERFVFEAPKKFSDASIRALIKAIRAAWDNDRTMSEATNAQRL